MTYDANSAYGDQNGSAYPGTPGSPWQQAGAPIGATDPGDLRLPLYGASFGQAVMRYFKKYATFSGRASRSEYWWVELFIALLMLIPIILQSIGLSLVPAETGHPAGASLMFMVLAGIVGGIIVLGTVIPTLALIWRRLHDANLAGPFWFLSAIPGVGSIILLVLMILPPKAEGQRFDR